MCEMCQKAAEKPDTEKQFAQIMEMCRALYVRKLEDYGAAWRILRPESMTDQIYIKARRIRSIETKGVNLVGEDIRSELIGIVNYGIMALIQLEHGYADSVDMSNQTAIKEYDRLSQKILELMRIKNHDYDEAWRGMRKSSYTDLILMKLNRTKEIEDNNGKTKVSEGVDANYMDMVNYAVFGLIKLKFGD